MLDVMRSGVICSNLNSQKKAQSVIGLPANKVIDPQNRVSKYGDWYVNVFNDDAYYYFVFMNEKTLLSFIMFSAAEITPEKLYECFLRGLTQLLQQEEVGEISISEVLSHYELCAITKTDSKKSLGNMNDLVFHYQIAIDDAGGINRCNVGEIIKEINRIPQKNINWAYSIDVFKELINTGMTA